MREGGQFSGSLSCFPRVKFLSFFFSYKINLFKFLVRNVTITWSRSKYVIQLLVTEVNWLTQWMLVLFFV